MNKTSSPQPKKSLIWLPIVIGSVLFLGLVVAIILIFSSFFGNNSGAGNYASVVTKSDEILNEAKAFIPQTDIAKEDYRVKDLDKDFHRLSCSANTSQYSNRLNVWLKDGVDEIAIIKTMRDHYLAENWIRASTVSEQQTGQPDSESSLYQQILRSPDKFGLTISRGEDNDGATLLQINIYSPCVGNPTDKSKTWGRG